MDKKIIRDAYLISAKRTAIGSFLGTLSNVPAIKLGEELLKHIIDSTKIDSSEISEVIIGQVLTGGVGQNPARQVLINSGVPHTVPAMTINQVCGSGLKSVILAYQSIANGTAEAVIAGGQENMSLSQHSIYLRAGIRIGEGKTIDMMLSDGLIDAFSNKHMGITAENIASKFNITRREQDLYALESQHRAAKAQDSGKFKDEILPITISTKKGNIIFETDEFIRPNTRIEILSKLKPAFMPQGTVTAGNSSGINDGAAMLLVASETFIKKYNLSPIARIVSYGQSGVDPDIMGTGPIQASKIALERAGWRIDDLDLIEANEAFAAQSIYIANQLKFDTSKTNVNGGAIALGHPIGASGTRILVTLIHEMQKRKSKKGLATLCIGGGMGISICIQNYIS